MAATSMFCWSTQPPQVLWRWLESPHQRRSASAVLADAPAAKHPAAVVVLGGGRHAAPGSARISEWTDADRFFAGLEAFQQLSQRGTPPLLLFTGGWWPTHPAMPPEGEVLCQRALALGLPAARLATTARVRNTTEEAAAVAALLPPSSTIVLITSAFHLPRTQRLFERQGLRVVPFPCPVDFQASGVWAGHQSCLKV
ncbi:MAG: YdcF family protein [Synechococcus sp.]